MLLLQGLNIHLRQSGLLYLAPIASLMYVACLLFNPWRWIFRIADPTLDEQLAIAS